MNKRIIFKIQFLILSACSGENFLKETEVTKNLFMIVSGSMGIALPQFIGYLRQRCVNQACQEKADQVNENDFGSEEKTEIKSAESQLLIKR